MVTCVRLSNIENQTVINTETQDGAMTLIHSIFWKTYQETSPILKFMMFQKMWYVVNAKTIFENSNYADNSKWKSLFILQQYEKLIPNSQF